MKNKTRILRLSRYLLLLVVLLSPSLFAQTVDYLALARGGAPQLALHFIEQVQPKYADNPDAWLEWESQRLEIYDMHGYWPRIIERVGSYPDALPADFLSWSRSLLAKAYLETGDGKTAREVLLSLLWQGEPSHDAAQIRIWRGWLIRAYLAEGRVDDAYTAVKRFQQDYGAQQSDERLLRARILLMLERYDEAQYLLEKESKYLEAKALMLLVKLRTGAMSPADVIREARWLGASDNASAVDLYLSWAVIHDAAVRSQDYADQVLSLEHLLIYTTHSEWQGLFHFNTDMLWSAYDQLAVDESNKKKILAGEDDKWLELADKRAAKDPHITRAIYAYLSRNATTEQMRTQTVALLADAVLGLHKGNSLYKNLYLGSSQYADLGLLPMETRYRLIDILVSEGDINTASAILATQLEPPAGSDRLLWQMRSARVLILAGKSQQGIDMLRRMFQENKQIDQENLERINQIAFDIQTIGEHQAALEMFQELFHRSKKQSFKRELLFWMADSYMSLGQYEQAALYYIQSANFIVGQEYDLWGQSAMFKAAEALEKAGMTEDARVIYLRLLKASTDDAQKALLRYKLQQLLLK